MTDARTQAIAHPNHLAKQQAIEYRRQLLRIVDQIERDYKLGKYSPDQCGFPLAVNIPELEDRFISKNAVVDTQQKK